MAFTLLKIKDNNLIYSSAGMPPVYIYHREKNKVEEVLFKGMPLGAMKKFEYHIKEQKLERGDTLLLLSDGLPELKNQDQEMFDYDKIKNIFTEVAKKSPQQIIEHLIKAGTEWTNGNGQEDDISLMVLKFV